MRKLTGLVLAVVLSAASGGCASTARLGLSQWGFAHPSSVAIDGLSGTGAEQDFIHEARLAAPPGCEVQSIHIMTDMDATFTYSCFGDGVTGL